MPKLQEILKDQGKILKRSKELGFETVRLYRHPSQNMLGVVVGMSTEKAKKIDIYDNKINCIALTCELAFDLNCQVTVISEIGLDDFTMQTIVKNSVSLPYKDINEINSIFGKDANIDEIDLTFEERMKSFQKMCSEYFKEKLASSDTPESPLLSSAYTPHFGAKAKEIPKAKENGSAIKPSKSQASIIHNS